MAVISLQRGFSLIELVMVIVLLSVTSVGLVAVFGQLTGSIAVNNDTQAAAQLAQECAEHILEARRTWGYGLGGISDCSALAQFNGFGPATVNITNPYSGPGCVAGELCKMVAVSAVYGDGASSVMLLLSDY